jgi:nitrate/nitrite-specific signal transduction histidine kinase
MHPNVIVINYFLLVVSVIRWVLSCKILLALSAMFTASINGDSEAFNVSVPETVDSSLLLLQAADNKMTAEIANSFFIDLFFGFSKFSI